MRSVNYYTRSPPDVQDSRIEESCCVKGVRKTLINQTNIKELFQQACGLAVINQYREQNCVTFG